MIDGLPMTVNLIFLATVLATVVLIVRASGNPKILLIGFILWTSIQSFLGATHFYDITDTIPPRFLFLAFPPFLLICLLFLSQAGREIIDKFDIRYLTYIHTVRIPVELVIYWLFLYSAVPEIMTFDGRNFDIIAGLTAPVVALLVFRYKILSYKYLLIWNIGCLALLFNIIVIAVLSAPTSLQIFAFDQPNVAVLRFPFVLLPSCIVPIVFFSHMVAVRKLLTLKVA